MKVQIIIHRRVNKDGTFKNKAGAVTTKPEKRTGTFDGKRFTTLIFGRIFGIVPVVVFWTRIRANF